MPKKTTSPARPPAMSLAEAAFKETLPEMERLKSDELVAINVDIPTSVSIALGADSLIAPLLPEMNRMLPEHPIHLAKNLRRYALAAWYAHLLSVPVTRGESAVKILLTEAAPLREALLVAAEALAHRKLLDPDRVAEIRAGQGNVDTANDLVALSALFTSEWSTIVGKTAVEEIEVQRAGALGPALLVALGERDIAGAKSVPSDAQSTRARAFTLLVRAYDECRRAVSYLRWHEGDVDTIAPSLFKKRANGSKGEIAGPGPQPPPPAPPAV